MINRANYHLPDALPSGWWDAITPLAQWVITQLRSAYADGYLAGRIDGVRDSQRRPPSGGAVVTM